MAQQQVLTFDSHSSRLLVPSDVQGASRPEVSLELVRAQDELVRAHDDRLPLSVHHITRILSEGRNETLLALLCIYGMGLSLEECGAIRREDIGIGNKTLIVRSGKRRALSMPAVLLTEFQELCFERMCGTDARRSELFRSSLEDLSEGIARILQKVTGNEDLTWLTLLTTRRAHSRKFKRLALLDLFDPGPRIVRRGARGEIEAYYRFRFRGEQVLSLGRPTLRLVGR